MVGSAGRWGTALAALAGMILFAPQAAAQGQPSTCHAVAQSAPLVHQASTQPGPVARGEVLITYVGHSAFRIELADGTSVVTDYNGYHGNGMMPPTVVTMNHAHSSHYTDYPDPAIEHVLRGWNPEGNGPASHYLQVGEMLIRNVATDLYSSGVMIEKDGNSIFIFEAEGLCIGHLGHLHHKLTPEHIAAIGRIDVLFMPVDGNYTMSQAGMIELAETLRSSIVIPMHFFSNFSLQRFLSGMQDKFETSIPGGNSFTVSLASLPQRPVVTVLMPY